MQSASSSQWADLLTCIVPREPEIGLLQALLWDGEAARVQWAKWAAQIGGPRRYFERDYLGRKGLLSFLGHRISASRIDVGQDFATYVRVAQVREELRSRIFIETLQAVQDALDRAGLDPILINGAAYAFTVYSEPLVRHNHGIDLMLPPEQMAEAKRATSVAGFRSEVAAVLPRGMLETCRHGSGLELTLRPQLFLAPHVRAVHAEFRPRCREVALERLRVRVLGPADRLCHTLGEAACGPTRHNLRWVCDAYSLLTRLPAFDYAELASTAEALGTALPTALLLEFFREHLRVGVPMEAIAELRARGVPRDARETQLLLSTALRSSPSVADFVRRAKSHEALFAKAARFAFFPSAEHIAYQRRPAARWRIPLLYASRIGRLVLRPFRGLRRRREVTS